jgi:predicted RNA-binding protein with TRAM domain
MTEVAIHALAAGGDGVGRDPDGRAVFVAAAAPGDVLEVELVERHERWARGELVAIVTPRARAHRAALPLVRGPHLRRLRLGPPRSADPARRQARGRRRRDPTPDRGRRAPRAAGLPRARLGLAPTRSPGHHRHRDRAARPAAP